MKKLFLLFVAAMFAATSFPACSDDDKDKDAPAQLVGTWESVHYQNDYYDEDYDIDKGDSDYHILVVNADGTFSMIANKIESGNFFIEGNKVTVLYEGDSETDEWKIKALNDTTLVLEESEEGGAYKNVWTYRRM